MIDWIKAIIPLRHSSSLDGGHVISINPEGVMEWKVNKRKSVPGSFDTNLHIQSDYSTRCPETGDYVFVIFDGNPAKFFQGHNLWGSDDLCGLMTETVIRICSLLNLTPSAEDWNQIVNGLYALRRVDSTMMLDIGTNADVEAFLYSAERTAHMRVKGQGIMTKGTLYFGKHSRRESLKMYNKLNEIKAKGHELPLQLRTPEIYEWTAGKLRLEATTRSMQLKDIGLRLACNWGFETPHEILNRLLKGLSMSEQHTLTAANLEGLPPRLIGVYHLWKDGHDLRAKYPKESFRRYRKQMQEFGIDIAIKQPLNPMAAPNVIAFRRVLYAEPCEQIPSWAVGTSLEFKPRETFPSYDQLFKKTI